MLVCRGRTTIRTSRQEPEYALPVMRSVNSKSTRHIGTDLRVYSGIWIVRALSKIYAGLQ